MTQTQYLPGPFPDVNLPPNRVVLIPNGGRVEEGPASVICPVGGLVMNDGSFGVCPHNVYGGRAEKMWAMEHGLVGVIGGITPVGYWDNYAVGDLVSYFLSKEGSLILGILGAGLTVSAGNFLISNGDGTLAAMPATASSYLNLYAMVAPPAVLTSWTTLVAFAAPGQYVLPANSLHVGDIIHIRARGTTLAVNSTNTMVYTLKIGATTIIATAAVNGSANDVALFDVYLQIRTIGATGTFVASGTYSFGTPGTATAFPFLLASTAIDTTATQTITVNGTNSVSNAGNQYRLDELQVDKDPSSLYTPVAVAMDSLSLATTTTTTTTTSTTPPPTVNFPASQFTPPANVLRVRTL